MKLNFADHSERIILQDPRYSRRASRYRHQQKASTRQHNTAYIALLLKDTSYNFTGDFISQIFNHLCLYM
jgi:glycogen debranching enzyme